MSHPGAIDLEAFACGERPAGVEAHVAACAACAAYVGRLRAAADTFVMPPMPVTPDAFAVPSAPMRAGGARVGRLVRVAAWIAPALAAAAAVALVVKRPDAPPRPPPRPVVAASDDPPSGTQFKGDTQIAVVRERDGRQERFTTALRVRPGDRFRVEVALDHPRTIVAAVLAADGQLLELMPEAPRAAGTHYSEVAARVDDHPIEGWIVVGTADEVRRAVAARAPEGVASMRVLREDGQ